MRLRFSIASLLAAIIFCGVGLAALRSASALWASALFTIVVALLSSAIPCTMASRGPHRLTWAGLAVFGWIYLAIAFGPWPFSPDGPPPLLTIPLLDAIQDAVVSDGKTPYMTEDRRSPGDRVMGLRGKVGRITGNLMPPPPPEAISRFPSSPIARSVIRSVPLSSVSSEPCWGVSSRRGVRRLTGEETAHDPRRIRPPLSQVGLWWPRTGEDR
jgi:MFS family permease